jgi:transcriptional regulator with AAA-type ATPase domain
VVHSSDKLETIPESEDIRSRAAHSLQLHRKLGLLVLWNVDEPDTIGAWLPISVDAGRFCILGRGHETGNDQYPRLIAVRQRGYGIERVPPFASPSLSRIQVLIQYHEQFLDLTNVGRRQMLVNGRVAHQKQVRSSDIIELGSKLAFLCTARPHTFDGLPARMFGTFDFGQADPHGLVGESEALWTLRSDIAFAAARGGHVLVLGASGVGKELVAQALHRLSSQRGPLVARNAATIPETLVDAELFGNMKGYPNPGMPERKGLLGAAHSGTLFLDEFADLPVSAQAHLLRVLDGGEYHRLGEDTARHSEFRLVAATNRPLATLRDDVIARFDFRIRVPELAPRREDIPILARHLLCAMTEREPELRSRLFAENGLPRLSPGFVRRLVQREYDTNVRELRNLLWRSVSSSRSDQLEWPEATRTQASSTELASVPNVDPSSEALQRALDANNGSLEKTWRALGLSSRHVLNRLLRKYRLSTTKHHRQ